MSAQAATADSPAGSETRTSETRTSETKTLSIAEVGKRPIFWTVVVITGAVVLGNGVLWLGAVTDTVDSVVFWAPDFAIVVSVVGLVSFGGFYAASRRARVAITASVITTFIVMLAFSLTITDLNTSADADLAKSLISDFRTIVLTVVGFYFGTETAISVAKIVAARGVSPEVRETLGRIDRDLPTAE